MPPKEPADLIVESRWLLPMAPVEAVLVDHAVVVTDGHIVALGPANELRTRFEPSESVVRPDHALLPGFVNAHTHAATTLLRGLPVHPPLLLWLKETAGPVEQRCISPDFVHDGTQLAIAEMLRAGITTFADTYPFPEEAARAAAEARVRAVIGLPVAESPSAWAEDATAHFRKAEQLWDEYKAHPWVSLHFAPQAPYAISDATLLRVRRVADELDARVAMSVHETDVEIHDSLATHGRRPLQRLAALGLLRPGFTAIHMNRLDEEDRETVARTGISVIACPQSNLRLGCGYCPASELAARGVSVGIGTGAAARVGALDMLAEARVAALLASGMSGGEQELTAQGALALATLGSASALGMAGLIGSIEPGKAADFVCVDLSAAPCRPAPSPADAVLYAATRQQVSDVWVGGRAAVSGGRLPAFDEQELAGLAAQWAARIKTEITT